MNTFMSSLDQAQVKKLLIELQEAEAKDRELPREEFSRLVNQVIVLQVATREELSRRFKVSRSTIDRWQAGITAPHPYLRPPAITELIKEVRKKCGVA